MGCALPFGRNGCVGCVGCLLPLTVAALSLLGLLGVRLGHPARAASVPAVHVARAGR